MQNWKAIRVIDCGANVRLAWAEGERFCLPASLLNDRRVIESIDAGGNARLAEGAVIDDRIAHDARMQWAFTERPPLSSRLPFNYQIVPASLRSLAARMIGGNRRARLEAGDRPPLWPLDLTADLLADMAGEPSRTPDGPTPVLLSHDLDSPEGLRNLVDQFLDMEESVGARSISYIVPCSWPIDHGMLSEIWIRGHEIGVHGYDHSNRTPFASSQLQKQRLAGARELIDHYRVSGYRSPSLLRTRSLLGALGEFYNYDSSIPTSGGVFPVPGNGCASARPFRVADIVEIPLSLPRDGSLRFLGYSPKDILSLWLDCAERISRSGGVVVLLTHCEERFSGNRAMRDVYLRFLETIAGDRRFAWSSSGEVIEALNQQYTESGVLAR